MDPDATLACLIRAATNGDPDALAEYAETLAAWLRRGGFAPADPRKTAEG